MGLKAKPPTRASTKKPPPRRAPATPARRPSARKVSSSREPSKVISLEHERSLRSGANGDARVKNGESDTSAIEVALDEGWHETVVEATADQSAPLYDSERDEVAGEAAGTATGADEDEEEDEAAGESDPADDD